MRRPFVFVCLLFAIALPVVMVHADPPPKPPKTAPKKPPRGLPPEKEEGCRRCLQRCQDGVERCLLTECQWDCSPEPRDPRATTGGENMSIAPEQNAPDAPDAPAPLDDSADRAKCIRDRQTCDSGMCSAVYSHPGEATPGEQRTCDDACSNRRTSRCKQLLGEK